MFEEKDPEASDPFVDFAGTWGADDLLTNLVPDPRQCAYDVLIKNVPAEVLQHPRLDGLLEWGGSSPGGGIDVIESGDAKGFEVLADVLLVAGFTGSTFKRAQPR